MADRVLKYPLTYGGYKPIQTLRIPLPAQILSVGVQKETKIVCWALAGESLAEVSRVVEVYPTGEDLPDLPETTDIRRFIGTVETTFQGDHFYWHVFERVTKGDTVPDEEEV